MRRLLGLLLAAILTLILPACTTSSGPNDRVLFLLGREFDPQEFWGPYSALVAAGYKVDLAGINKGEELKPDSVIPEANIEANLSLAEVDVSRYFALFVPGGPGAANVGADPKAGQIAKEFDKSGKFIGLVCHGSRVLMPEGIFKNRKTTFIFMVADELCDQWKAGDYGMYLDLPVVLDKNLIGSRDPRDIPKTANILVNHFAESGGLKVQPKKAKALIVLPGVTEHQKWVLDRLSIFGITHVVVSQEQVNAVKPGDKTVAESDMLVILEGAGISKMNSAPLTAIVNSFSDAKKPILVSGPAKKALPNLDLNSAKVIQPANLAYAMRDIVDAAPAGAGAEKLTIPDSKVWAENYTSVAKETFKGAGWNPQTEYDAVIALWNGYDDYTVTKLVKFFAGYGKKILIAGPKKETLRGLNGSHAEVAATYNDPIKLSDKAIIVAPGGLWPKKTKAQQAVQPKWVEDDEPARQKRYDWLIDQYKTGKLLVAFGFDSLYIGQRPMFKGKSFASTDQASVIWFGDTGAVYSPEKAMFSDKKLMTAKPLVGVDDAIKLLQDHLQKK